MSTAPVLTIGGRDVTGMTRYDVSVDAGRADIEEQPDGSVLQAKVLGYVDCGEIGDEVVLADEHGVLFHGYTTDLKADLNDEGWWTSITATGPLAALGHTTAGAVAYPAEAETERVARLLSATGIGHKVLPTTVPFMLMERPIDVATTAEIARKAATDGMGVLWENPADMLEPIRYTPHDLRKWNQIQPLPWANLPADLTWATAGGLTWATTDTSSLPSADVPTVRLDPSTVPAKVTFEQTISDLIRTVTVVYGPEFTPNANALTDDVDDLVAGGTGPYVFRHVFVFKRPARIVALRFYRSATATQTSRGMRVEDFEGDILGQCTTSEPAGYQGWVETPLDKPVNVTELDVEQGKQIFVECDLDLNYHYGSLPPVAVDPLAVVRVSGAYSTDGVTWVEEALNRYIDVVWEEADAQVTRLNVVRGGEYPAAEFDTDLSLLEDAERYAESMLRRHKEPAWRLSSVSVDLAALPPEEQAMIRNGLLVGSRVEVPFPHGSPVGPMWQGFLEGWHHTLVGEPARDGTLDVSHTLELNASERRLTEAAETWGDITPTTRWADTGDLTWNRALDAP